MGTYTRQYAEIDGSRIALWDSGPGGKPTLVFVHGIGGAKAVWSPVLDLLPRSWRLIAYDYRGGGESEEAEPAPLSVARWTSDLKALLDERRVEGPLVLVGHSLGATIVLQFALDWPGVADGIVLAGAQADLCRLGPMMQQRSSAIVEGGVDGWVRGPWRAAPPFSTRTQRERPEIIDDYSTMLYTTGAERYIRAVDAIVQSPDLSGRLAEIAAPALVLIGGEDDRTTPEVGWALARGLPNGRGVEFPEVGHTMSYEIPNAVAGEIIGFVEDLTVEPSGVSTALLDEIIAAFNSRDCDRIASYFAEDAVFVMASGPSPEGRSVKGRDEIRKVLAERFAVIPDLRWDPLYSYTAGKRAVSVWRVTGRSRDGTILDYQGCDLWEFENGLVQHKDTYWKIVRAEDPWQGSGEAAGAGDG